MDSFAKFVHENWDYLCRLSYLLAGSSLDADDLLQDALVKAMRSWPRVQRATSRRAYLRRILTTTAIDSGRDAKRRGDLALHAFEVGEDSFTWESGFIDRSHLASLIAGLPARQRAVIVLRYYEDMSERQIAAVLDCRPGTVKSQASAALRRLSDHLQTTVEGTR